MGLRERLQTVTQFFQKATTRGAGFGRRMSAVRNTRQLSESRLANVKSRIRARCRPRTETGRGPVNSGIGAGSRNPLQRNSRRPDCAVPRGGPGAVGINEPVS